jgi:magnesium transporter
MAKKKDAGDSALRLRTVAVTEDRDMYIETEPYPSHDWLDDGVVRWLTVEGATRDELAGLFTRLGADGATLADHITGDAWYEALERETFAVSARPTLTSWRMQDSWFHLIVTRQTIIAVHADEIPDLDAFIQHRWLDHAGIDASLNAVLKHVVECYIREEIKEFSRIRLEIEQHAKGLRQGDRALTVEHLEHLMEANQHMTTVFFEFQRLCDDLFFTLSSDLFMGIHRELFQQTSHYLKNMYEGTNQLQRRLEELQRQHQMDQQKSMEARVRILTIVSVVFLPLTLISGIYGMRFQHMPELDYTYAYFIVLGGMLTLATGMLMYFIRKGWFR